MVGVHGYVVGQGVGMSVESEHVQYLHGRCSDVCVALHCCFGSRDRSCRDTICAQYIPDTRVHCWSIFLSLHVKRLVLCLVGPSLVELACWRVLESEFSFFNLSRLDTVY